MELKFEVGLYNVDVYDYNTCMDQEWTFNVTVNGHRLSSVEVFDGGAALTEDQATNKAVEIFANELGRALTLPDRIRGI